MRDSANRRYHPDTPAITSSMRLLLLSCLLAATVGCSHLPPRNPMAQWVASPNHDARRPVLIVLHATEQDSVAKSLLTLRTGNRQGPVSAHYLIGRDGYRYQLVADELRAWHAGPGRWGTITDVNSASIGIELDNDGEAAFADAQIASLLVLLEDLCTRLRIPRGAIIAHADLAPERKRDPGARFPWRTLAAAGFGRWPDPDAGAPPPGFDPWLALRLLGYPLEQDDSPDHAAIVRAFHRHYRGNEDETLDAEDARILWSLQQQAD